VRLEQRRALQGGGQRGCGLCGYPLTAGTTIRVGAGIVGGGVVVRGAADGDREQDRDNNRGRTSHRGVTVLADARRQSRTVRSEPPRPAAQPVYRS
jgi:hypothetical protein